LIINQVQTLTSATKVEHKNKTGFRFVSNKYFSIFSRQTAYENRTAPGHVITVSGVTFVCVGERFGLPVFGDDAYSFTSGGTREARHNFSYCHLHKHTA